MTFRAASKLASRLISIHVPLAGNDHRHSLARNLGWISIHVPLAGNDPRRRDSSPNCSHFNPRSPCGERRRVPGHQGRCGISTHAPLAGSDASGCGWRRRTPNFNPRSPCGERHRRQSDGLQLVRFQPTLPLRGATMIEEMPSCIMEFQPTLPLRGAT